jgi:hypothetical protein
LTGPGLTAAMRSASPATPSWPGCLACISARPARCTCSPSHGRVARRDPGRQTHRRQGRPGVCLGAAVGDLRQHRGRRVQRHRQRQQRPECRLRVHQAHDRLAQRNPDRQADRLRRRRQRHPSERPTPMQTWEPPTCSPGVHRLAQRNPDRQTRQLPRRRTTAYSHVVEGAHIANQARRDPDDRLRPRLAHGPTRASRIERRSGI